MKYTFWIITLFFSFAVAAQEPLTDELTDSKSAIDHKAKHSFIFSGGMFVQNTAQKSNNDYYGWSASGAYQIYFPSRFVLGDRKSTRLNSSHVRISYAVFCLKKK